MEVYYGKGNPITLLRATDLIDAPDGGLTDADLADIAMEQYRAIYKIHPLDKAVQRHELQLVLGAAK